MHNPHCSWRDSHRPEAANEFYDGDHDNDKESDVEIWRYFQIPCGATKKTFLEGLERLRTDSCAFWSLYTHRNVTYIRRAALFLVCAPDVLFLFFSAHDLHVILMKCLASERLLLHTAYDLDSPVSPQELWAAGWRAERIRRKNCSTRWEGKGITRNKRGSACSVALVTHRPAQMVAEVFKDTISNILIIHVPYSSEKSSTSTEQGTISTLTDLAASVCKATEQKLIQELPVLQFLLVPVAVLHKTEDNCWWSL